MLGYKPRAVLLSLLAMLLVGSFVTASAEAMGPFWYHRNNSGEGKGVKLSAQAPEEVRGGGGEVILEGKLLGTEIEMTATQSQVKGIFYNGPLQGQAKLQFAYFNLRLIKPAGTTCTVVLGKNNIVKVFAYQAWTWNGTEAQLKEQPQTNQKPEGVFFGQELQQGATSLPKGVQFTTLTLQGAGCLLASTGAVSGSVAESTKPEALGEFSKTGTGQTLENGASLHFWNGKENIGATTQLTFAGEPAKLKKAVTASTFGRQGGVSQEVALFES